MTQYDLSGQPVPPKIRPCTRCKKRPRTPYGKWCRPCINTDRRKRYHASQRRKQQVRIDAWRRQGIDLTWEQYETLLEDQDGLCAICGRSPGQRALSVDHDHDTGQVRALLCHTCNIALGAAQEDPELLRLMAEYLETHQTERPTLSAPA